MTINDKIKTAIKKQGFTISSIAKEMRNERTGEIGITQPAMSDLLKSNISYNRVEEIANIIGLTVIDVINIDSDRQRAKTICPHCGEPITVETIIK